MSLSPQRRRVLQALRLCGEIFWCDLRAGIGRSSCARRPAPSPRYGSAWMARRSTGRACWSLSKSAKPMAALSTTCEVDPNQCAQIRELKHLYQILTIAKTFPPSVTNLLRFLQLCYALVTLHCYTIVTFQISYLSAISGTPFRIILSRGRETPCFWLAREGSPAQSRGDRG